MTAGRLNVLLITADQLRADCLSGAGHPLVRTPALDRLARRGTCFTRHFGQAIPCGPARASLLTGMYQMNHRAVRNGTPIADGFTTLATAARQAGYLPWIIGYTDSSLDSRGFTDADPRARKEDSLLGFRQYAPGSELASADSGWKLMLREQGYAHWRTPFRQRPGIPGTSPGPAPLEIRAEHSHSAYIADQALRFFRQFDERPWFLHVSFLHPHPPFLATAPWNAMYRAEDVPAFAALPTLEAERAIHPYLDYRLDRLEMNPRLPMDGPPPDDNPAWRQARASYYGLISELDHHVGRMLDALAASGQADRTLIVFTSDHGEMLGDHWCWGKEVPFDKAVHVPLIISAPGMDKGRTVDAFTEHVDLMPTILDLIGAEKPLQCDGHSLRPLLAGEMPTRWRDAVFWEYDFRNVADPATEIGFGCSIDALCFAAVRTETAKYVRFAALPALLYALRDDPDELADQSGEPALAAVELALAGRMLDWRLSYARRELTGLLATSDGLMSADRYRRIS